MRSRLPRHSPRHRVPAPRRLAAAAVATATLLVASGCTSTDTAAGTGAGTPAVATARSLPVRMQLDADQATFALDGTVAVRPVALDAAWSQQAYLKSSDAQADDEFGSAIAMSGDTIVVGAPYEDTSGLASGAAYVFVRSGTTWTQQALLKAPSPALNDFFGFAVAVSGDTIVVAAIGEDTTATDSGAAFVFVRSGTTWTQQAMLKAATPTSDSFGWAVALSGDTALIGAPLEGTTVSGSGAAFVFVRSGTTWTQQAMLKAATPGAGDRFGDAVALSGDTALVGAPREDSPGPSTDNSGAAYTFTRTGATWSQQAMLKASTPAADDAFGDAVALSGDTALIGSPRESTVASNAGAATILTRSGSTWSEQAVLRASNSGAQDRFGTSVALSDGTAVVGAYLEDGAATGVGGDGTSDAAQDAGAAYAFTSSGGTWTEQAYLKASNTGTGDSFGQAVAVSGRTVALGAPWESSDATSVDGDQTNDLAGRSGAAYVWLMPAVAAAPAPAIEAPSITCGPDAPRAGATIACTVSGAPADFDFLWRAAHNPVFAEGVLTTGADGTGTIAFTVPADAAGDPLTVELVAWTGPVAIGTIAEAGAGAAGVAGGPVPTRVDAGLGGLAGGPAGGALPPALLTLLTLVTAAGIARRRLARTTLPR